MSAEHKPHSVPDAFEVEWLRLEFDRLIDGDDEHLRVVGSKGRQVLDGLQEQLAIEQQERADFEASQARLLEQLEAAQRERSHLAQRARSFFIDYEDDCPHPVAMFLDDISVDPASNPASEPEAS